jgi:hypothetical protein
VKGAAIALGVGLLGLGAIALIATQSSAGKGKGSASERSIAKRVADAIATRDPKVMRSLAAQLEAEGNPDAAEGLRMAADLAESQLPSFTPIDRGRA